MHSLLTNEQVRKYLNEHDFKESTEQDYETNRVQYKDNGLLETVCYANNHNVERYLPSYLKDKEHRKYIIIKLPTKRLEIKAWGY
ncbi:hypothetical protein [Peribacillus loiseleuriae]|uniref:Uncharacterized protein n=1 Tax=Peribacillus loiseleuriae TaxID=1679170 RepID=A0A0K9GTC2_9BACI|nr:hypothetical protein [Peribacillus loiseleuriae]KMY49876.1 hypothetical protein AC625_10330 [Peribacillus loiseleuriae]